MSLIEDERQRRPLLQYFKRYSRFEETVDIRLKKIHLMQVNDHGNFAMNTSKSRHKKGNNRRKKRR